MGDLITRLKSVEISNFKNVGYGFVEFKKVKDSDASILGLYGQNGSGKTAFINALSLLKSALCGAKLNSEFADFIAIGSEYAKLKFCFIVADKEDTNYRVEYEFKLKKEEDDEPEIGLGSVPLNHHKMRPVICDEVLSYSYQKSDFKRKFTTIMDTSDDEVFTPKEKYKELVGGDEKVRSKLVLTKQLCHAAPRSFIFSKDFLDVISENCKEEYHKVLLNQLKKYGRSELFVIGAKASALASFEALPLSFKYEDGDKLSFGTLPCSLNGAFLVPQVLADMLDKVVDSINIVLPKLVPGLTIRIEDLGTELLPDNSKGERVQLVALRDGKEIPLKYESEGIRKLVSVLQLLIFAYSRESITVAIDELDSGVFEYLLGEMVKIIAEKGKGQLIFTSHNLRPLELIDSDFIAFTTVNPQNRYVRINGVKKSNNLRSVYYRDIVLGGLADPVYDETDDAEISYAFRKAGAASGA